MLPAIRVDKFRQLGWCNNHVKMDVLLQEHRAKHIYKVPEGLRELCADIAREVLRSQPRNIYCFIADYVEALLITRENAKVAVRVVNNILLGSQAIVGILHRSGLSLEQIARAAPKIQKAFRAYLDAVDMRAAQVCDDATCDAESRVSLQSILRATGVSLEQAEKSATIIQAAFRGHYERMLLNESQGIVQWQRAATRTLEILRKAGASQAEASRAAILIQATYRGYYTRRNLKMKMMAARPREKEEDEVDTAIEPAESVPAVAWLDMMSEESGLERAHEAASVIQKAYKRYREKKADMSRVESSQKSMVVGAILNKLHQRVFDKIMTREDIPTEFGDREDLTTASEERQRARMAEEDMMSEESGLERAHEAASVIQKAYKRYREKKANMSGVDSQKSIVVGAILNNLHQKVFDKIMTREDIPTEFGDREDLTTASEERQRTFKEQLTRARMAKEEYDEEELDESSSAKSDDDVYGVEDGKENREIETESERDEETDV